MAEAISAADRSLSLVIQFLHWIGKANTTWLLRIAGLASCDCRATESMRWLCYPHQSRDWTGDRFIPTNFACWDKHRYRRPNIRVNTIHRSQKGCSLHEARAYAATYLHHYFRRGGRVASTGRRQRHRSGRWLSQHRFAGLFGVVRLCSPPRPQTGRLHRRPDCCRECVRI